MHLHSQPVKPLALWAWLFVGSLLVYLPYIEIHNDHFDRISRGQQILEFGAVPFQDFFDPGWLLAIYSSAAMQAIFGPRLLGEALLSGVLMAAGIALAAVLVHAVVRSRAAAVLAAVLLLLAQPRAYDYDKVFFYPLGLLLCWRYADRPDQRSLLILSLTTVLAGLYRYDNGIYIAAAALVTLTAVHWPDIRILIVRGGMFVGGCVVAAAPAAVFLAAHGGIADAFRQVVTYARIERERTALDGWPTLSIDPTASFASGSLTTGNAETALYYLLLSLPIAAVLTLLLQRLAKSPADRGNVARGLSAAALCGLASVFVLRDPIRARYAAVAVPGVVLTAWLLAPAPEQRWPRGTRATAAVAVVALAFIAILVLTPWTEQLRPLFERTGYSRLGRLWAERRADWRDLTRSTPETQWITGYLARCTAPDDRVIVVDFQPQIPMAVGRGFAGGMLVFFGDHWNSDADQQRIVDRLQRESVPIVLIRLPDSLYHWPLVSRYLQREYVAAGDSAFGRSAEEQFRVLVKKTSARPAAREGEWGLPCFSDR